MSTVNNRYILVEEKNVCALINNPDERDRVLELLSVCGIKAERCANEDWIRVYDIQRFRDEERSNGEMAS